MYSLNMMRSGVLHASGGGGGDPHLIPGMPITVGNFAFRALQFTTSVISLCIMATASDFHKVTAFRCLIVAGILQCLWSLAAVLLDLYTWDHGYALASPKALGRLAIADIITFTLTFSAACGCAGVTTLPGFQKCSTIPCLRFKVATAMMFISSFTTLASFTVNFWKSSLLRQDNQLQDHCFYVQNLSKARNVLTIKVSCTYGTHTSFVLRLAESGTAMAPLLYMATSPTIAMTYTFFWVVMSVRFVSSLPLSIFDLMKITAPQTRATLTVIAFIDGVTTALAFAAANAACAVTLYMFHDTSTCVFGVRCWAKEIGVIFGYIVSIFSGIQLVAAIFTLRSAV